MTATQDDTIAELERANAELRQELAARTAELAQRNSQYGERIEHQAATIDVLKAMSASPGDARPVFELIVERARSFCGADHATAALLQDGMLHLQAYSGMSAAYGADYELQFPRPVDTSTMFGRAILSREVMQTGNLRGERDHIARQIPTADFNSIVAVPILREGTPIGAIALGRIAPGGFSDSQIELLKTFAEQAVIAIGSAGAYRALQTRTSELQEALEYQTATSDVLKVISRSTFDLKPVLSTVTETAARLCAADQALLVRHENGIIQTAANFGVPPEYLALLNELGPHRPVVDAPMVTYRAIADRRVVHIHDVAAVPGYAVEAIKLGQQRTSLGVPLLRAGEPIGSILLARRRVEPFTDRQIELVNTFADQAVIAIENTRLLTEQQEALEQRTATAEVLQVINSSPGDLKPVFDTMLEKAMRLCGAAFGSLYTYNGERFRTAAQCGVPPAYAEHRAITPPTARSGSPLERLVKTKGAVHILDLAVDEGYLRGDAIGRALLDIGGARTALMVPLLKDESVVGAIVIYRQEVQAFSQKQIALVENFAAQAVIAIENARLLDEIRQRTNDLQQSLEYQTATSDVLKVISRSTFDLKPVLEALLSIAKRLCDADYAMVSQREASGFRALATQSASAEWAAALEGRLLLEDRSSVTGRAALTKRPVQIADADADPDYALSGAVAVGHTRTCLGVPLLRDGVVVGAIALARTRVEPFTDRQIELVSTFADQAVIAIENTRLITEQREALEQQTATAEILSVINNSPGELTPVFDAMLDRALRLCEGSFGTLFTFDGEFFHQAATRNRKVSVDRPFRPTPKSAGGRLLQGERFVHIADARDDEAYRSGDPNRVRLVDGEGARSYLAVPMRKGEELLGTITIYRQEVRPFTDKQIALLQNFASQAVIAMENARLLTETREALEQQTATAEVLGVINSSPGDLAPVFDAMLEKAMRLCEAGFGSLYTYDGDRFQSVAQRGVSAAYAAYRERHPPELVGGAGLEQAIRTRRAVQVTDMMAERPYLDGNPNIRAMVDLGGMRSGVVVPLCKDETALGVISVFRQEVRPFSDRQIALLESFAAQAVIAIENTRLLTEQREALERQTATAEVLRTINENPGNLGPVFDVILEKALSLAEAAFGSLWIYHGDTMHAAATRGMTPALAEFRARNPVLAVPPVAREASETRRAVQMLDIRESESYRAGRRASRAIADLGGARTNLVVPLLKDNESVGSIQIYRQEVRVFTPQQISLLEGFAAQAVIAMDNARLLNEIRQRQNELDITFENMGDGVAMFDRDHRLAAWNRNFQDIIDLPDEAVRVGLPFADYIRGLAARGEYGPDANADEQIARLTVAVGQANRFERTRPNGRVIDVRHNPIQDGGFVVIYADITERKRAEEALRVARDEAETALRELKVAQANLVQAEKMASLGQLTAGIAHEIKNPLNFVNNFAALSVDLLSELKETAAPGFAALTEKQRADVEDVSAMLTSNLEKINEHGRRADGIVKAMLEHSRGSSGERRTVDLNALIDEALNLAYHGARAQDQSFNITLERDFGEGIAPIEVNPQDITRVFLNIFSNGFYATTRRARDGGDAGFEPTLKVTTRNAEEAVEIRVRDNGTGVPADIRDKLFQPFFTTKPTGEGTGLGLSITYDIVTQQHGGSIAVDSKVGEYSEFTIQLPRNP